MFVFMSLGKELLWDRKRWKLLIVLTALAAATLGLAGPLYQKAFIDSLAASKDGISFSESFRDLSLFFICFMSSLGFQLLAQYLGQREALVIQKNLSEKIYTHMLALKADRLKNTQVGEIVSLYAIDAAGSGAWMELAWTMGALSLFPLVWLLLCCVNCCISPWVLCSWPWD